MEVERTVTAVAAGARCRQAGGIAVVVVVRYRWHRGVNGTGAGIIQKCQNEPVSKMVEMKWW